MNGLKNSFVCPNGNQQDRVTNDLVLAGSQCVKDACCCGSPAGPYAWKWMQLPKKGQSCPVGQRVQPGSDVVLPAPGGGKLGLGR